VAVVVLVGQVKLEVAVAVLAVFWQVRQHLLLITILLLSVQAGRPIQQQLEKVETEARHLLLL
jgi:hypothetical protein